jgi:iron complex transport system permease protein
MKVINLERQRHTQERLALWVILILIAIAFGINLRFGLYPIDLFIALNDLKSQDFLVMTQLRLPRFILGLVVGGSLAISGFALQTMLRNPLAEPGLIGVSSGAMIMVLIGIVLFPDWIAFTPLFGLIGAFTMSFLVYRLATFNRGLNITMMLLAGIALNALAGAVAGLLIFLSNEQQLKTLTFWSMGSLSINDWSLMTPLLFMVSLGLILFYHLASSLEVLQLGEREAQHLGVSVQSLKSKLFLAVALTTGASVALCGLIGFVGLIIPHITRQLFSFRMKTMLVMSFLFGGLFLAMMDLVARTIFPPSELAIGIVTSFIGTPYFIYLIIQRERRSYA